VILLDMASATRFVVVLLISAVLVDLISAAQTKVSISDTELVVSDSQDAADIKQGRKYRIEYPNAFTEVPVSAEHFQHLYVTFRLKNQAGKAFVAHQAFLTLRNPKTQDEIIFVAKQDGKQYTAHIDIAETTKELFGASGEYQLILTVGDKEISNPFSWTLLYFNLNFPNESKLDRPEDPFAKKPEIRHLFRLPESRPPAGISSLFTLAVLSPIGFLLIGFLVVGANIKNFPFNGLGFIYAVGFQACLGALLLLFVLFWFELNMVQTLLYLGVLSVPTIIFAQKNLSNLATEAKLKTA